MRLWRISDFADLSGTGGLIASGRWHSRGQEIVYLAESPAGALLERLVHLEIDPEDLPASYQLLAIDMPNTCRVETVDQTALSFDWRVNDSVTRTIGDDWLKAGAAALLRVPSAIVPYTFNYLLNPGHADAAKATIAEIIATPFDRRLLP